MPGSARPQPLIAVRDVRESAAWYATLLGLPEPEKGGHGDVYARLMDGEDLVLQLHRWDDEEHPNLVNADAAPHGHGVLLWFEVADFDAAVERAAALGAEIVHEPRFNPYARHHGIWLRDRDDYVVVLAG
ncbi:MAG: VOC family protein [Planctomycetota bacterium]|jgi:catechol 2,3-dioxygenase-like lactoylglutathione lyase family enzyme